MKFFLPILMCIVLFFVACNSPPPSQAASSQTTSSHEIESIPKDISFIREILARDHIFYKYDVVTPKLLTTSESFASPTLIEKAIACVKEEVKPVGKATFKEGFSYDVDRDGQKEAIIVIYASQGDRDWFVGDHHSVFIDSSGGCHFLGSGCHMEFDIIRYKDFTHFVMRTGKHRPNRPCRLHSKHPIPQDTGGKSSVSQSIYNLKDASKMLNFLTAHSIMDMAGLDERFAAMLGEQLDIGDKLKPIDRHLPVLKKHIEQADIYFKHRGKKTLNEADQILFVAAVTYLKGVMNGKTTIPTKEWKSEYAKLTAEQKTLNQRYLALKDKVKEAEQIRRSVYDILRREEREQQPRKEQEVDR